MERADSGGEVRIGDTVRRQAVTFGAGANEPGKISVSGTVIYIHPKGRYHTVEFDDGHGRRLRECFPGTAREEGDNGAR